MSFGNPYLDDPYLTDGVMSRRLLATAIDALLLVVIIVALGAVFVALGVLTFGIGLGALGLLPFVPVLYQVISLTSSASATPGQQMMGLKVRRDNDFGPPTAGQALVAVLVLAVTMVSMSSSAGLLLVVALFTVRHRTLHDILSGLVVVRTRALTAGPGRWNMRGGASAR